MIPPYPWLLEAGGKPAVGLITEGECRLLRWAGGGVVVEVGAFAGCSTLCLAEKARVVHTFDPFLIDDGNARDYLPALKLPEGYRGSFRHIFDENTKGLNGRVVVHEDDAAAGEWDAPIDCLFIDASCGAEFQLALYRKFYGHVKPGGLLIHQDFFYYRSPSLAPLMAALWPAFQPIGNADTSMVYRRSTRQMPQLDGLDIDSLLPQEIEKYGGLGDVGGGILASALVYHYLTTGQPEKADGLARHIMRGNDNKRVWDNLRQAYRDGVK